MVKKDKLAGLLTPEQVIRIRLRSLADMEDIRSFITKLVIMAAVVGIMFGYVFGITPMKNKDMFPKISNGDLLLYYRLGHKFRAGDVVVIKKDGIQYVARIAAMPGEKIEITDSSIKVNDSTMVEADIFYRTGKYEGTIEYPVSLTDREFFVLCDYREGAKDSRVFGPVDKSEIQGKVITILRRNGL